MLMVKKREAAETNFSIFRNLGLDYRNEMCYTIHVLRIDNRRSIDFTVIAKKMNHFVRKVSNWKTIPSIS